MSVRPDRTLSGVDEPLAWARVERLTQQLADIRLQLERTGDPQTRGPRRVTIGCGAALVVSIIALAAAAPVPNGTTVKAPFQVVDGRGKVVLTIGTDGEGSNRVTLRDGNGKGVLEAVADSKGGFLYATTADSSWTSDLDVSGSTPFFKVAAKYPVDADPSRDDRISFDVTGGKPFVRVKASTGHGVVQLSEDGNGFGRLDVATADGHPVVTAGSSKDSIGVVEAFPLGNPLGSIIAGVSKK